MRVVRFNTALGLLLTGVLLVGTQFVLLTYSSLTHSLPRTVLTVGGTGDKGAAGCHDESAPSDQNPKNHDCCTVGHLYALGSALVHIALACAVTPVNSSILLSANIDNSSSQATQVFDTGPPGSAVPIRV